MRAAHAAHSDWRVATDACLASLGACDGANLGFVYASDAFALHLGDIEARLREATGVEHWVGSVGVGICAGGVEYFGEAALGVLVGRFPAHGFRVFPAIVDDLRGFEAAHGDWCERSGARFAVVHADPHNAQLDSLIPALCARMDGGYLVGGLTSSRGAHPQLADGVTCGGLSGVLFAPDVRVATRLTQGCTPIGPRRAITRCRGNVLFELDGLAALDVLYADIGEALAADPARLGARVFAGLPVKGSDTGDYLVRNLAGIDEQSRALAVAARVEEGDRLMFCRRDAEAASEDMTRMLAEIEKAAGGAPRGGVYYTCLARGPNLFGANSEELTRIRDALGDVPLVGFFGNGEIAHDRLYGYTGVLTLFL